MDTNEFLGQLILGLQNAGLTQEQIDPKLNQMSEYLDSLSETEREKELSSLSANIGKITNNIVRQCKEAEPVQSAPLQETMRIPVTDADHDVKPAPARPSDDTRSRRNAPRRAARTSTMTRITPAVNDVATAETQKIDPVAPKQDAPVEPKRPAHPEETSQNPDAAYTSPVKFSELDSVAAIDQKNQTLFWVVFALTLPITAAVLLLILSLFAGVFLFLAAIVAVCVGALVGITAAGTIVSLFGLVYGVTQLFTCPPAGLYEIGFATMIAGAALFGGIIIYNIAIRFIPWLMKKFYELFLYVAKKIYKLFLFIRRECTGK